MGAEVRPDLLRHFYRTQILKLRVALPILVEACAPDAIRHQQADLSLVEAADKYAELEKEKATLEAEIARLREVHSQKLSKEAQKLMKMPFQRAITKKEQADMGKLKKSVRGLVVVHPMTALGREMGLQEMTGFSKTAF